MLPKVSIIVPCYNEQSTIRLLLEALCKQSYPRAELEVIVADGMSTDRTREVIAAFQKDVPDLSVRVVENAKRSIPSALNRAIEAARGEILIRLDGHSQPYPDYVASCIAAHQAGRGANVGGVWEIRPGAETWIAKSIAVAAAHPLRLGSLLRSSRLSKHLFGMQAPWFPERHIRAHGSRYVEALLRSWSAPGGSFPDAEAVSRYRAAMSLWPSPHCALEYHRWVIRSRVRTDGRRFAAAMRSPSKVSRWASSATAGVFRTP